MILHMALIIISYITLLVLLFFVLPLSMANIFSAAILFFLGIVLIIRKKLWARKHPASTFTVFSSAIISASIGYNFCVLWLPSAKLQFIVSALHIPISFPALMIICTLLASALASYFIFLLLVEFKKSTQELRNADAQGLLKRDLILCLIASIATVVFSQIMIGVHIFSMGYFKFLLGTLIVASLILFIYCICGSIKVSSNLVSGVFLIISIVNVYLYSFRERLFEPIDILSATTAMNVAGNYNFFPIPLGIIFGVAIWGLLTAYEFYVCAKASYRPSAKKRLILLLCAIIGAASFYCCTINLKAYHWQKLGASSNGYVVDFITKFKEIHIKEPESYSEELIAELENKYPLQPTSSAIEKKAPHIIVIMDEAFSDLGVHGELSTSTEVTPFISSLKEDTISGYALASVYGGNTANSEYEFLTGNSMAWLFANTVPYQQYFNAPSYSAVSYLKNNYNYECVAMHPYLSSGWNRPNAYKNLGFDSCLFIEDFPQQNFVRDYVSDCEMFETLIETYEEGRETPLFIFGVSMQNHGGYTYTGENYTSSVSLSGYDTEYPDVEQYLSLINETDKAAEYLVSYFSNVDDDVVIVFFGDHQPKINEAFFRELNNNAHETLDVQQNKYKVPFFVWANYDIEERWVDCTSLNFLSTYMYNAAGIDLPPYNQFLSEMEECIPSININGFYSLEAKQYLPFDAASKDEQKWLKSYEALQYNSHFDRKNLSSIFFPTLKE